MVEFENLEDNEIYDIIINAYKRAAGYEEFEPMDGDAVETMAARVVEARGWSKEEAFKFENYANIREGNIDPHKYDINLNEMEDNKEFRLPTLKEILENSPENESAKQGQLEREMKRLEALAEGKINENFQGGVMGGPASNAGGQYGHGQATTVNSFIQDFQSDPTAEYRPTAPLSPEEALSVSIKRVLKSGAPVNSISFYDEVNLELQGLGFPGKNPLDIKNAITALITK